MNPFSFPYLSRVNAVMAIVGGVGLFVVPDLLLRILDVPAAFDGSFYGRAYATGLLNIGVISWATRDVVDVRVIRGVTAANAVQDALIVGILLHAVLTGQANGWTWGLVVAFGYQVVSNAVAYARSGR
ncbi:MAG: hypothetical protein Q8P41_28640 [Pseudomonadota bacterium]|nr:hypothetical protein [Pseudomonadota bacterium]